MGVYSMILSRSLYNFSYSKRTFSSGLIRVTYKTKVVIGISSYHKRCKKNSNKLTLATTGRGYNDISLIKIRIIRYLLTGLYPLFLVLTGNKLSLTNKSNK